MNNCIECGHCYELHSADSARCPKNDGELINGKLEFFATHYEPGIPEIEQLHARIAELESAHAMQGESLVVLPRWMVSNMEDKMKAQAEDIRELKRIATNLAKHLEAINHIAEHGANIAPRMTKEIRKHCEAANVMEAV